MNAEKVTAALAKVLPADAAVGWVMSAGVVHHAVGLGLLEPDCPIETGLERIAAAHPALAGWTDPAVNPMWTARLDVDQRRLVNGLRAPGWLADRPGHFDGIALGDLYQQISDTARLGRALVQTPLCVADMLYDLAVDSAIREWGIHGLRVIDPACGTGHLLVQTLLRCSIQRGLKRLRTPTGWDFEDYADGLEHVHGVDIDPFNVAVAAYRLVAFACYQARPLADAADLPVNVAVADSLLAANEPLLARGRYHAVVANPPYIRVKDPAVNKAIRAAYPQVCHKQFSLALPFFQLMTDLCRPGGYVAQITTNAWMKREYGRPFIEKYLPTVDVDWIIDTSGAYIPGHGTPTVIMRHRNQPPTGDTVRAILGVHGEPSKPANPEDGVVWQAIRRAVAEGLSCERFAAALAAHQPGPAQPDRPANPVPAATAIRQLALFHEREVA